ncbi:MAG: PucR family transcriptional regulator ligand-binding domain-containing protein [Desulfovibrio sp.]|jgi:purine catabolism regulator|nr:PucR family transcriptional regulator ligand-binding domain-containing protein [Desulfovibrio sp.]
MKLSELLEAVPEAGLTVMNQKADLNRPVDGLDTSETPDIAKYIKPNTLLLTTAMLYRDDQKALAGLIKALHHAKAAGLAVKLGRFVANISPGVMKKADELGFPILRVPMDTTLGIVSHMLQSRLMRLETKQFHYALDIQKKISQALFRNSSLEELLRYFARLLNRHVLYYDYFFNLAAFGTAPYGHKVILSEKRTLEIGDLLLEAYKLKPFTGIEELLLQGSFGEIHCMVSPVVAGNQYPFFLVILHEGPMVEPFSSLVTELAGNVFSFSTHNQRLLWENEWRAQEELFFRLTGDSRAPGLTDIHLMAPWMKAAPLFSSLDGNVYQVVAVGFNADGLSGEMAGRDHFELIYRWLKKKLSPIGENCQILPLVSQGRFLLLWKEKLDNLPPQLETLSEGLWKIVPLDMRFGLGNQAHSLGSLQHSYLEAVSALEKALSDGIGRGAGRLVHFYYSEGAEELFQFVPREHIRHFCLHILGELAYPENEHNLYFRKTLEAYLNCQGDITRTSKKIYVHRNTVTYRMEKIQHLLGKPLEDPDYSLMVRLAILLSGQQSHASPGSAGAR